jgi:acyl carrier protein
MILQDRKKINMKKFLLEDIDSEDAEDLIPLIELSFNIRFEDMELSHVSTLRDIYNAILGKFTHTHTDGCTSQKAFYFLRKELKKLDIYSGELTLNTPTKVIFKNNRISTIKKLEDNSGLKLNILRPPHFITIFNLISLITGLITLVTYDKITGFGMIAISIFSFWLSNKKGSVLIYKSTRELINQITRTNYARIRQDNIIKPSELENILIDLFMDYGLTERPTLDSKFGWADKINN